MTDMTMLETATEAGMPMGRMTEIGKTGTKETEYLPGPAEHMMAAREIRRAIQARGAEAAETWIVSRSSLHTFLQATGKSRMLSVPRFLNTAHIQLTTVVLNLNKPCVHSL